MFSHFGKKKPKQTCWNMQCCSCCGVVYMFIWSYLFCNLVIVKYCCALIIPSKDRKWWQRERKGVRCPKSAAIRNLCKQVSFWSYAKKRIEMWHQHNISSVKVSFFCFVTSLNKRRSQGKTTSHIVFLWYLILWLERGLLLWNWPLGTFLHLTRML